MTTIQDVLEGRARWVVVHGDNREVLPTLPEKSVAHVITDPPYSEWVHTKNKKMLAGTDGVGSDGSARTLIGFEHITPTALGASAAEFARTSTRWILVFSDVESVGEWRRALERRGVDHVRTGAWVKQGATPQFSGDRPAVGFEAITIAHAPGRKRWNGGGTHALWTHPVERIEREHTTPKPLPLMLELVELFTDPDDIVLDPFCGSGTTGVACLRLGRRFIGIEKDAKYAAVARERLAAESQGLTLRDARAGQQSLFRGTS